MRKWIRFFICTILLILSNMNIPEHSQAQTSSFGAEWFGEGILYEIFVRSFSDSNGDGIGDLQGITQKLDYIQSLGVNTIWLMPVHPSPSYHGYDVIDYYTINPDYGTVEDMLALIQAVHERGMYIIIDYIANHTSNQHPFFADAFNNPASEHSHFYKWVNAEQTNYQGFAGIRSMPEINYDSQAARDYMIDVALYWLDPNGDGDPSDGVDGFRCDVATGPPLDFWAELRAAMREKSPDALLLAEAWIRSGLELKEYLTNDSFNAVFDFPTYHTIAASHDENGDGVNSGATSGDFLEIAMNGAQRLYPIGSHLVRFANNHDTNRIMSDVEGDFARARATAVWLLTGAGTPMLYYGEEIGMFGVKGTGNPYWDEYRREPFDWYASETGVGMTTWFKPNNRHNLPDDEISVEEQENDPDSLLNFYRALGQLRNNTPALRTGQIGKLDISSEGFDLYAMWRGEEGGDMVMVIINFMPAPITASFNDVTMVAEAEILMSKRFRLDGATFTIDPAGYAIIAR